MDRQPLEVTQEESALLDAFHERLRRKSAAREAALLSLCERVRELLAVVNVPAVEPLLRAFNECVRVGAIRPDGTAPLIEWVNHTEDFDRESPE